MGSITNKLGVFTPSFPSKKYFRKGGVFKKKKKKKKKKKNTAEGMGKLTKMTLEVLG